MNFIKTFLAAILAFVVGSVLVVFLWIFILLGIAGSMEKSVAVHPESILKLDFSEVLTDAPSSDPFAGFDFATLQSTRMLPLMKALRALEAAKDDPRIKGIYLRMNGNGGVAGSALLEELREAIVDFKQSGKFVVAYNETYSQGQYYLASAADRIYMQPEGGMDWSGLSFNLAFYKGLLDKLDVKAEVFRPTACKYKSAVEPYILPKMSDANREQMQELVNSMWNTIAGSVAEARGIDLETLNRITDKLEVSLPEDALEHGFVDSLVYEDQMNDVLPSWACSPIPTANTISSPWANMRRRSVPTSRIFRPTRLLSYMPTVRSSTARASAARFTAIRWLRRWPVCVPTKRSKPWCCA